MMYVGIDPGASGGAAAIHYDGEVEVVKFKGITLTDLWWRFKEIGGYCPRAAIEVVHSMPGQGVSSTFKFGQSYGNLEAFLVAAEIPFERVAPTVWQREFGLTRKDKSETKTAKKNRHKAKAQELFPSLKITHATADALLIAEWLRRTRASQ